MADPRLSDFDLAEERSDPHVLAVMPAASSQGEGVAPQRVVAAADAEYLAADPHASDETLAACAVDDRWPVRLAVASNPSCPEGVIEQLCCDSEPTVAEAAAVNAARGDVVASATAIAEAVVAACVRVDVVLDSELVPAYESTAERRLRRARNHLDGYLRQLLGPHPEPEMHTVGEALLSAVVNDVFGSELTD